MRPSHRCAAVIGLVVLAGCESEEGKTERLRDAAQADCLPVATHELNPKAPAPTESERAKCDAARRAYNAFLEGR
jgi:outer membrane murein-binding lipoprotein Lpp